MPASALIGRAAELARAEQLAMIDLNVRALTELSLAFIDSLARHKGGILNVASLASFLPAPGMAVYYATKAYVLSFSEALHAELRKKGVRVTALCPGRSRPNSRPAPVSTVRKAAACSNCRPPTSPRPAIADLPRASGWSCRDD